MTDPALVLAKLTTLEDHVQRVERRLAEAGDVQRFRLDLDRQDALALSLIVALQEAADIALHIASDAGWGVASSYSQSFEVLSSHGVIDTDLCARMIGIATLRNRIAHGYGSVDFERIWHEAPHGMTALRAFAAAIAAYLTSAD